MFFEKLFDSDSHISEIEKLSNFIGIDPLPGKIEKKVHTSVKAQIPSGLENKIIERFSHVYSFVSERFKDSIPPNWKRNMEHRSLRPTARLT
jgi:hypothetical protein